MRSTNPQHATAAQQVRCATPNRYSALYGAEANAGRSNQYRNPVRHRRVRCGEMWRGESSDHWEGSGLGEDNDHFCVGIAFLKKPAHRDKVEYFPHVPVGMKCAESQVTAGCKGSCIAEACRAHRLQQPSPLLREGRVGQLLVRQRTMCRLVMLVAALGPGCAERGLKGRISRHHADGLLYQVPAPWPQRSRNDAVFSPRVEGRV